MARSYYMSKIVPYYVKRLTEYFEYRASQGLGVPESPVIAGAASTTCIADDTGIAKPMLDSVPELRECILNWGAKIGFSPSRCHAAGYGSTFAAAQKYKEKIRIYLTGLKQEGKKIPENPRRSGYPDWERIARESDLSVAAFAQDSTAKKLVQEAVADIGLELYHENNCLAPITYGDLLREGSDWRKKELEGKPREAQQLSNTRTHLRCFMRLAGKLHRGVEFAEEDPVGHEMLEGFRSTVQAITAQIKNKDTRRKFSGEIPRWQVYYSQMARSKGLPPKFAAALMTALLSADMNAGQLAREAEVDEWKVYTWLRAEKTPSFESFPDVRRLEDTLALAPDTLLSRIILTRPRRIPSDAYPESITIDGEQIKVRGNWRLKSLLTCLLPDDFCEREPEERSEIVQWLAENLVISGTEWSRWLRALVDHPFKLKETPLLKEELDGLISLKRAKLVPVGMRRSGSWSEASARMFRDTFLRFMRFLALPSNEGNPLAGGAGLDPSQLTMALLICDKFVDGWVRWMANRRRKSKPSVDNIKGADSGESYAGSDLQFVIGVAWLFHPETGWLTQNPEIARHLRPVPGYIDEALIGRALSDWGAVCSEAFTKYGVLIRQLEEVVEEQRDPFEPILPLLDLDHPHYQNPIPALRRFTQNIIKDMPDGSVAPLLAAIHLRNYLIARILIITALRSRNIRELTYKEDNTGQLRRRGEEWVIVIPWQSFKNKDSSFFGTRKKKHDYVKVLKDKDGLYGWIDMYLSVYRPQILKDKKTDIFFAAWKNNPLLTEGTLYMIYRRLTMRYLSYNKYRGEGIPGVMPHGPHAVRDIIATFVLQQTGSYDHAAYAIGDAAQTVREHYGRFMPKDKVRLVDKLIDDAWDS